MPNFDCESIAWERLILSEPVIDKKRSISRVLVGEASDLLWPPGRWPVYVTTNNALFLGGDRLFGPREAITREGELGGYRYPQTDLALRPVYEIHVLND
jgi:hypothetical protein